MKVFKTDHSQAAGIQELGQILHLKDKNRRLNIKSHHRGSIICTDDVMNEVHCTQKVSLCLHNDDEEEQSCSFNAKKLRNIYKNTFMKSFLSHDLLLHNDIHREIWNTGAKRCQ